MIYPRVYSEKENGRWIDIINPLHPDTEVKHCIWEALQRIDILEDFRIVFRYYGMTFTPQVRFEKINGKVD